MYLAYLDESGDQGWGAGSSSWFILSCMLIHENNWLQSLDRIITLRKHLKDRWGIPPRAELKSEYFRWGNGAFTGLDIGLRDRMNIYKDVMEYQASSLDSRVFATAIKKGLIKDKSKDARHWAWTFTLQRIDRFCTDAKEHAMILPDRGHAPFIRKLLRGMRRHHSIEGYFGGKLDIPTQLIVEDPVDRLSKESYLIQVADWNAYAARRSPYVEPTKKVRPDLWDKLTPVLLTEVNKLKGGPPGIVIWP
jgi:hypothetical protein